MNTKGTTIVGFTNRNQQVNLGLDNPNGNDHGQSVYVLRCDRVLPEGNKCGQIYGANGSDIHQRLCPKCQGGKAGLPLTKSHN
jgi:hypothetical protein